MEDFNKKPDISATPKTVEGALKEVLAIWGGSVVKEAVAYMSKSEAHKLFGKAGTDIFAARRDQQMEDAYSA